MQYLQIALGSSVLAYYFMAAIIIGSTTKCLYGAFMGLLGASLLMGYFTLFI